MKNQFERIEDDAFKIKNEMQVKLALRLYGFGSDEKVNEWINEYSEKFRQIMEESPEILAEYAKDSEEALSKVEKMLYEKETAEK